MKAIVAHEYGGPDVLKYEDVAILQAKENEALRREKGRAGGHANSSADRREEGVGTGSDAS